METKVLRVYDRVTDLPIIAIKISKEEGHVREILTNAGYFGRDYILFMPLEGSFNFKYHFDPISWFDRTNTLAHKLLIDNWDKYNETNNIIDIRDL